MKFFSQKWLTLVELVIAITISVGVLSGIAYFLTKVNVDVDTTKYKTDVYVQVSDFVSKMNSVRETYNSGQIIVDGAKWAGFDILLLTNKNKTSGILMGVANINTGSTLIRLEPAGNFDIYDNKVLAIQEISSETLSGVLANTGSVYSVTINPDKTYPYLLTHEFQVTRFNSGAIFDIYTEFYTQNYPSLYKKKISELWDALGDVLPFNFDF